MAEKFQLPHVTAPKGKRVRGVAAAPLLSAKWPRKDSTAAEAREAVKNWQAKVPVPAAPANPDIPIRAVEPTVAALSKLAAVVNNPSAPAVTLEQKLDEKTLLSTVYSAFLTYRFMQAQSDFKQKMASARMREGAQSEWPQTVGAFQRAFSAAGLAGVTEDKLSQYARQLAANRDNLNAVTQLANSAVVVKEAEGKPPTSIVGSFVPQTGRILDPAAIVTVIPNLCATPLAQGVFTKHFAYSFSWTVTFQAPCFPQFWKTCWYSIKIATVSFALDVNVAYKVDCCGAVVAGQAVTQACITVMGKSFCASCTGTLAAVAGLIRTPVGGGKCNYGLAINATLQCKYGSSTLFSVSAPFSWTVTGPCPPPQLSC